MTQNQPLLMGKKEIKHPEKPCGAGGRETDKRKVEEETLIWAVVLNISSQGRGNQETQHQCEARSNLRAAAQWVVRVGFLNRRNEVKSTSCTWVVSRVNLHVRKQVKTWFYTHKTFYLFIYIRGHLKNKKGNRKNIFKILCQLTLPSRPPPTLPQVAMTL